MLRLLHLVVIATLVIAAVNVYKIKYDAAVQAERVAKLRSEVRREREQIAALRAQWARLDNPARIQELAQRHLPLQMIEPTQFDDLARLPPRPRPLVPPDAADAIAALIETIEAPSTTGSAAPAPSSGALRPRN
jgi:cell division protein FtsL